MNRFYLLTRSLVLSLCLVIGYALQAQVFYVTPGGAGDQTGSSWSNAAPASQLQYTINNASAGSEIWVAAGTYKPTAVPGSCKDCRSPRDVTFFLKTGVALYGGFAGNETAKTQRSISANPTILSGDVGVPGRADDNSYHVVLSVKNDNTTILDGFHITEGSATGNYYSTNISDPASIYISGSIGAGVMLNQSAAQISNCFVYNNSSFGESTPGGGSAISIFNNSNNSIINCVFNNNTSNGVPNMGTILVGYASTPVISNSTFSGNNNPYQVLCDNSSVTLTNCIMAGNGAGIIGQFHSGTASVSYSLFPGGYSGTGNINANPLFANPSDPDGPDNIWGTADDGLRLSAGCAAINGGNNASLPADINTDITGAARIQNGKVDMGAYEGAVCPQLPAGIVYVDSSKSASGNGTSWATAFRTLNEALNFANDCSFATQVWVRKGTYYPTGDPQVTAPGSGSATFSLKNNLAIYGGFNGNETSLGQRNILTNPTILSGDIGVSGDFRDNIFTVVSAIGNDSTAVLDGFTIRDGDQRAAESSVHGGAGLYSNSSPVIVNCTFINNITPKDGGGILLENGFPQVINCSFFNNSAKTGGAININGSGLSGTALARITNCKFPGNNASLDGSELNVSNSLARMTNCVFLNHPHSNEFLTVNKGRLEAVNCTFLDNTSLSIYSSTGNKIANCIFAGSSLFLLSSEVTLNGNSISGTQSVVNLGDAPVFVNAADPDGADDILGTPDDGIRLMPGSPGIDAGNNDALPAGIITDITGAARIQNGRVDMGAYEGTGCPTSATLYVDNSIATPGNGGTWATAFKELRMALSVASQCSNVNTIYVAKGTYLPTIDGNRDSAFAILRGGLKIYGGYPSGGGDRDITANPVILSGNIGSGENSADNSYHVIVIAGLTAGSDSLVLDGLTVTGGNADGGTASKNYNGFAVTRGDGGGIYMHSSNGAGRKIAVRNCIITGNGTFGYGGGWYNQLSSPAIVNCIFTSNQATSGGGIINYNSASPVIINSVFTGNTARSNGGGLFNWNSSSPEIINSTIQGNTATNGGAIYNSSAGPVITNSIVWGNSSSLDDQSATVTYSTVEGAVVYPGTGNQNSNPLFINPADARGPDNIWGTADDGLKLIAGSAAANSGNNTAIPAGITTDITGTVIRIQNGTVDRGAYEGGNCVQAILYVDRSIATSGNGGTWATAFKELREALSVASQCDNVNTIYVAKGTYLPTVDGNRDSAFSILRGGLKIYGGYPSGGGTRNIPANATLLSGDIGNTGDNSDNSYHVVVIAGLAAEADSLVLDGFTITGANANGSAASKNYNGFAVQRNEGGGLYLRSNAGGGKIAIRNCYITANATATYGGGFYNHLSSPGITNCIFTNNQASSGAGLFNFNNSSPVITNTLFIHNTAAASGGGIYNWNNASPVIINSTFQGNNAMYGGAICNTSATPVMTNSIVWGNSSSFNEETAAVSYSIIERSPLYPGTGNRNSDPAFVNAADPDGADNNFGTADDGLNIKCSSPAINGGINSALATITSDITGNSRIQQSTVDMGAYESPYAVPLIPSVKIGASVPGSVCAGTEVTFTATPVNGGSSPVYQWKKNNVIVGNNSATYTINNLGEGDKITVQLTSSESCVYPGTANDTLQVDITPLPARPVITASGATSFCTGGSVTLSAPEGFSSYLWSNGATSQSITVNQTGSFTVIVKNSNGCSSEASDATTVTVNALPVKPTITASGATTFCTGGSVTLSAPTGFTSYSWSNGATAQSINVTESGSYSVTVGNSMGCTSPASDATTVTVNALPAKPTITASGATSFCTGGSVTLSAPNGFTSYLWSNGATTPSITVTESGSYNVVVTNSNGCNSSTSDATTVTVNALPAKPTITASGATSFCTGGSVTLSAPNGFTSYLWSNGATTQSINVTESGSYTVAVTNSNGCSSVTSDATTVTVNSLPAKPTITASGATSFCTGGSVTLSAPTGFASYLWSNGAATPSITVTESGSYNVVVTNSNGCSSATSDATTVTVNALPAKPTITASGATSFCTGGSVTLSAPNGFTSYLWSNGATTQSINVTESGSYTVAVTNSNGCSSVTSDATTVTVNALPVKPIIIASGATTFCTGGSVTLSASNGFASYLWSNGATAQSINVTESGSYSVTVGSGTGCNSPGSDITTVTVNSLPAKPTITASGATTFCVGGSVTLSAPTGFASYLWSNGTTTQSINVTESGSYTVTVTNSNGCSSSTSDATTVIVSALPAKPTITASGATSFCTGGSVTLSAPNGFASYLWSNGSTTQSINVTESGSYTVAVTNSNGCSSSISDATPVTVNALPAKPTITASGATSFCTGGSVTLSAPGGFSSYLWSNGATTQSINVTESGVYTVAVTNSNGCSSIVSDATIITVNALPAKPTITASGATTFCVGGSVILSAPNGFASYLWSNGATTQSINVSVSGTYSVITGNGTACTSPASNATVVTVNALPAKPTITASGATTFCAGGSVTLSAPNGFASYLWNNGATTQTITVTQTGSYTVKVSNGSGCGSPASDAATVTVNALPAKPVITSSGTLIFAQSGSVTLSAPAGFASYLWSNGATTSSVIASTTGTYTVVVRNSSGCSSPASDPVTVTVQAVTATLSVSHMDADYGQLTNNNIRPYLQVNNEGSTAVAYKDLVIRYWLTVEDFSPMTNLAIDWAQLGTAKVKMKYVKLGQPRNGAFGYIEYTFDASAGNLAARSNSGPIQSRAGKSDWTNFNEADDYSYSPSGNYAKNGKITLYRAGTLVWGTEPAPVPATQSLKLYSKDNSSGTTTNTISNWIGLNNEGNKPVSYKDITIRYWFTADGNKPLNYSIDYAVLGSSNVKGKFVKLPSALPNADTYLEISFTVPDSLYPISSTGNIQHRISKSDWSNFNQLNDHSYKPGQVMTENTHITVYLKGILVYGTEPASNIGTRSTSSASVKNIPEEVTSKETAFKVTIVNNPVISNEAEFIIRGAEGKNVQVSVIDVTGKVIAVLPIGRAGASEHRRISLCNAVAGVFYLKVIADNEMKTVSLLKLN